MKDLGDAKKIPGMKIERDRVKGTISFSQKQYLKKVLHHFGMFNNIKHVSTPLAFSSSLALRCLWAQMRNVGI